MITTLATLGANLDKVVVTDFVDGIYHSTLHVRMGHQVNYMDAHVTDAINLAFINNCPILVEEEVFDKSRNYKNNLKPSSISDEEAQIMFESIDPDKPTH